MKNKTTGIEWIDFKKEKPKTKDKWDSIPILIATNDELDKKIGHDVVGCFYSKRQGFHTDEGLGYDKVTHFAYMPKHPDAI